MVLSICNDKVGFAKPPSRRVLSSVLIIGCFGKASSPVTQELNEKTERFAVDFSSFIFQSFHMAFLLTFDVFADAGSFLVHSLENKP